MRVNVKVVPLSETFELTLEDKSNIPNSPVKEVIWNI